MTLSSFSAGPDTSFSTKLNNNFKASAILLANTTGFGSSASSSSGTVTDTDNYESPDITASQLGNADYLVIDTSMYTNISTNTANSGNLANVQLQIQTKDLSGAYSDTLASSVMSGAGANASYAFNSQQSKTYTHIHVLSAGEKANGIKIKFITLATATRAAGQVDAAITLNKIVVRAGA